MFAWIADGRDNGSDGVSAAVAVPAKTMGSAATKAVLIVAEIFLCSDMDLLYGISIETINAKLYSGT
jgi:hypothetical protein